MFKKTVYFITVADREGLILVLRGADNTDDAPDGGQVQG
jgi:hypothetical protein